MRRTSSAFRSSAWPSCGMYTAVTPLQDALTRSVRRILYLLWGGAAFVLLIGALNIANLALARASVAGARAGDATGARRGPAPRDAATDHRGRAARWRRRPRESGRRRLDPADAGIQRHGEHAERRVSSDGLDRRRLRRWRSRLVVGVLIGLVPATVHGQAEPQSGARRRQPRSARADGRRASSGVGSSSRRWPVRSCC